MVTTHFPAFETKKGSPDLHPLEALIKRLTEAYGPPGYEERVRDLIREEVKNYADELRVDTLGNLIVKKRGSGGARKKIMLAAHMDETGLMVTHVDQQGFCRFRLLGEVQPLALLGQRCVFANGAVGVVGREGKRAKAKEIEVERLFLDLGARGPGEARVEVGDAAGWQGAFVDAGRRLIAKALDDRVGCAVLVETLRALKKAPNDVYFVFTVQQQVGGRGATTSTYGIQPDFALAIDTTASGDTPEAETVAVGLGKGPAIKIKDQITLVSPMVRNLLTDAAREAQTPYQLEVAPQGTTDAEVIQVSREGVLAGAVSIPLRYAHTPSQMADLDDVQNAIKLVLALVSKPVKLNFE